jgi:ribosomal protein S18 acetylase RimI-like enzyme
MGFVMSAVEHPTLTLSIPVTLRIGTLADIPKMEWYGQYAHHRNLFLRTYREQLLDKRLLLIADSNNFPVGHVSIQFIGPEYGIPEADKRAYLYSLRVMEMFRGYGIGTCLIQEAEFMILKRGYFWSTIAVAKNNIRARQLYQRLGYAIFAEDPGQWSYVDHRGKTREINEPCWLLQKNIDSATMRPG